MSYGPPPGQGPPQIPAGYGYPQGPPPGPPPDNYLVWAILSTVLCCLPLGIASIVFSSQVSSKWAMGDYAGAVDSSTKAKQFAMWSAIAYVIVLVLIGLFYVLFFGLIFGIAATTPSST
jgi:ABC-type multidrug transport system permease subunit